MGMEHQHYVPIVQNSIYLRNYEPNIDLPEVRISDGAGWPRAATPSLPSRTKFEDRSGVLRQPPAAAAETSDNRIQPPDFSLSPTRVATHGLQVASHRGLDIADTFSDDYCLL